MDLDNKDFNFLVYLGWKTLGWALVFMAVILLLRFMRLWLLHAWLKETAASSSSQSPTDLEWAPRIRTLQATSRRHYRERLQEAILREEEGAPRRGARPAGGLRTSRRCAGEDAVVDLPPNYEEVMADNSSSCCSSWGPIMKDPVAPSPDVKIPLVGKAVDGDEEELPPEYATLFLEKEEMALAAAQPSSVAEMSASASALLETPSAGKAPEQPKREC